MAITKRSYDLELTIKGGPDGFVEAYRLRRVEYLDDGVVDATGDKKIELSLAQLKSIVAAL